MVLGGWLVPTILVVTVTRGATVCWQVHCVMVVVVSTCITGSCLQFTVAMMCLWFGLLDALESTETPGWHRRGQYVTVVLVLNRLGSILMIMKCGSSDCSSTASCSC